MPRVPSPAAEYVGLQLRAARERRGMSQDQLAVDSDIDSSNVRAYESGRALPNLHSLIRLASALSIAPGALIDELTPDMFVMKQDDARRIARRPHARDGAGSAA